MIAAKTLVQRHQQALQTSSRLTGYFRQMHQPGAAMVSPKKVTRLLQEAKVKFVLMGTHGLGSYRSEPRATQDVDVLVRTKDHGKAVQALKAGYPKLRIEDGPVVTRFVDPKTNKQVIDLMKPIDDLYQLVFQNSVVIDKGYAIPDLEMALTSKFAAMVSSFRDYEKKHIDVGDFMNILRANQQQVDRTKLKRLAEKVYSGGGVEIIKLVDDILAGRPIQV